MLNYITETVYRRGARRWKKFYHVNGHRFQAKRFNRRVQCFFCNDYIWGLGRQGYRCADCKLCVHKKCHRAVRRPCGDQVLDIPFICVVLLQSSLAPVVVPSPSVPVIASRYNYEQIRGVGLDNHGFNESHIDARTSSRAHIAETEGKGGGGTFRAVYGIELDVILLDFTIL
uniref:Phorbol-ester/DAG-type domain-containing protein n=1 Tax=Parascaris equorum TaxID=6256 RepID=A0A914S6A2_PAREQ